MLETIISCYGRQWTKINIKERTIFIQASATPQKTVNITRNALRLHPSVGNVVIVGGNKKGEIDVQKFEWVENGYRNSVTTHHKLNHAVACRILTCHCLCSVDLSPHTSAVDPVFYPACRGNKPDGFSCPMLIFSAPVKFKTIRIVFVRNWSTDRNRFFFVLFICKWNGRSLILFGSFWRGGGRKVRKSLSAHSTKNKNNANKRKREKVKKRIKFYKRTTWYTAYEAHKIQNGKNEKKIQKHKSVVFNV